MNSLHTISLESNNQIKINFDGGNLSSDAGLLLFKEFLFKLGAVKLINRMFKTNDTAWFRIHKDDANLMQVIYQTISSYFVDDCADELSNDPVMTAILDKNGLASRQRNGILFLSLSTSSRITSACLQIYLMLWHRQEVWVSD